MWYTSHHTHRIATLSVVNRGLDRSTDLVRHLKLSVCPQEQVVQHKNRLSCNLGSLAEVVFLRLRDEPEGSTITDGTVTKN